MSFSLAAAGGTDTFGNTYPTGILSLPGRFRVSALSVLSMDSTSTLLGTNIQNAQVLTPSISGGTASSLVQTMTNANGSVLGYTTGSSAATFATNGVYQWTCPTGITTARVRCWGAAAGGSGCNPGSRSNQGGPGAGAGEYAEEPSYPVIPGQVYTVVVGNGGQGGAAGFTGTDGTITQFYPVGGGLTVTANQGLTSVDLQNGGAGGSGSSNTIHFDGGNGASANGGTGGGGGGSSGSQAGQGNPGNTATGATGGTGGAAISGGGAGGAGGNSGVSGVNGGAPSGGGGGGGSSTVAQSKTYTGANGSYCYNGADASGNVVANSLRNVNGPMIQGEGGGTNVPAGHQYSYLTIPYGQIQSDLSGQTIISVSVTLQNIYTWYASGMGVNLSYSNKISFGSSGSSAGSTFVEDWTIGRGATLTHNVGSGLGTALQSGAAKSLLFGPATTGGLQYYGYYSPSACAITVFYHLSGTVTVGGNGSDGQVIISYGNSPAPTYQLSVSAVTGTDSFGNPIQQGFQGPQLTLVGNQAASTVPTGSTVTTSAAVTSNNAGQVITTNTSGFTGLMPAVQTDYGTFTLGNSTVSTSLTKTYTIPGGDAQLGTIYEIEVPFSGQNGTSAGEVLNIGVMFDGSFTNIVPVGTVVASAVNHGIAGAVKLRLTTTVNGISGTWIIDMWGVAGDTTLNRGNTPGMAVLYGHSSKSLDLTASHTISVAANWGAAASGQTMSGIGSILTRSGP